MPPVAAAIITGAAAIYGAVVVSEAQKKAANLSAQGSAAALAFEKEKAAQDLETANATSHANYDQWAAREGRMSSLGEMIGLPKRNIPAFSPLPGTTAATTPTGTTTPAGTTPTSSTVPTGGAQTAFDKLFPGATLTPEMLASQEGALNAQGMKLLRNAAGRAGKILLPDGTAVDVIEGAGSGLNRKQWLVQGAGGTTTAARTLPAPYTASPASAWLPGQGADPSLTPALMPPPPAPWRPAVRNVAGFVTR